MRLNTGQLTLLLILTAGCGDYHQDYKSATDSGSVEYKTLSFDAVKTMVLEQNCFHCHSAAGGNNGNINFETYENTLPHIQDMKNDVQTDDMPMGGPPFSAGGKAILFAWIAAGAPETSDIPIPGPTPTPTLTATPSPMTSPVSFKDVETQIFSPYCVKCHGSFSNYSTVKADIATIQSKIASNAMPKGGPALSDALKKLLNDWVTAGMPH